MASKALCEELDELCINDNGAKQRIHGNVDVNTKTPDKNHPLHCALLTSTHALGKKGRPSIVAELLGAGVSVNAPDKDGHSPLHLACWLRNIDIIKMLIEKGADVIALDKNGETPIHMVFKDSLVAGPDHRFGNLDENWIVEVYESIVSVVDIVHLLLDSGASVNTPGVLGSTLLHLACSGKDHLLLELLISRNADVNACDHNGESPLLLALRKPQSFYDSRMVVDLINAGANVDFTENDGTTALHIACERKELSVVQHLISRGADVNARNVWNDTPLHVVLDKYGVSEDYPGNIVSTLVEAGADIQAVAKGGNTPLHLAAGQGYGTILQELLQKGASVNVKNIFGCSPLHLVVGLGDSDDTYFDPDSRIDMAVALLEAGADLSARDGLGPPLHCACKQGDVEMVQLLLAFEADPLTVDANGDTPFSYVNIDKNTSELIRLLHQAGVRANRGKPLWQTLLERHCGTTGYDYHQEPDEVPFQCGADGEEVYSTSGPIASIFYKVCESGGAYQVDKLCERGVILPRNLHRYLSRESHLKEFMLWTDLAVAVVLCRAGMDLTEEIHELVVSLLPTTNKTGLKVPFFSMYIHFAHAVRPYNTSLQMLIMKEILAKDYLMGVLAEMINLYKSPAALKTLAIHTIRRRLVEVRGRHSIVPVIGRLGQPPALRRDINLGLQTDALVAELLGKSS